MHRGRGPDTLRAGLLAAATAAACAFPVTDPSALPWPSLAVAAAAAAAGRWGPYGRPGAVLAGVCAAAWPAAALVRGADPTLTAAQAGFAVLCTVLPWLVGRALRYRSEVTDLGWRRAELLERERALVAARERARTRERIAARMHDSLGHDLSLLAVRAGALEVAEGLSPQDYRRGAAELGAGAIGAVERLQEIIGLLDGPDTDPEGTAEHRAPGIPRAGGAVGPDALEGLLAGARGASVEVSAAGAELWEDMAPPVRVLAHAVVREALTNAVKHAPGAAVAVDTSRTGDGGFAVAVRSAPGRDGPAPASGGRGLAGLRDRVAAAGGVFEAGPGEDGGFRVAARLPARPDPAPGPGGSESDRRRGAARRARRAAVQAAAVPAALLLLVVLAWSGYYASASARAVLPPPVYAGLEVGAPRSAVEPLLPPRTMLDPPEAAAPSGWECVHYRSGTGWPGSAGSAYRLCFAQDRLAAKDEVPLNGEGTR
ncbi:sensor histidine kinase [Nocardiopsis changdeensis]|uniref:histidine kinase n=1 Tax=Nocardiopsis changdeensis TaxID=2831969 RepID=A0ABX8BFL2_9ACTN|nr:MULTISPECIES: sensor histidine kinase [Nocardiopsis]QUX20817.1 two-component sensor histidine kinase [Nocardiopsis changdeensis]QYX36749.1 two-component sensor histidine kinase [Nocardiopsis sp. MT53]